MSEAKLTLRQCKGNCGGGRGWGGGGKGELADGKGGRGSRY